MKNAVLVVMTTLLTMIGSTLFADDSLNVTRESSLGHFWSDIKDIKVSGNYAYYAGDETGLIIFDITDRTNPVEAGFYQFNGRIQDLAISGQYAYCLDRDNGMRVLDVSNPASPTQVGSYDYGFAECHIVIEGTLAYVSNRTTPVSLMIFDISDPTNPTLRSTGDAGVSPIDIAHDGTMIYLSASNTLVIFDATDPDNPALVNTFTVSGSNWNLAYGSNHVYIAAYFDSEVNVVNVADPLNPSLVSTIATYDGKWEPTVDGNYLYASGAVRTDIYDISNPAAPVAVSIAWGTGSDVVVDGTDLYFAKDDNALWIFDVTDPTNPIESARFEASGPATQVLTDGNYAYYGVDGGVDRLRIMDISDPLNPAILSTYDIYTGLPQKLTFSGDYIYSAGQNYLEIVDVSDKLNPVEAYRGTTSGDVDDIAVSGNYAYLADGSALRIYDVTDPTNPVSVGSTNSTGTLEFIAVNGSYAYLGERSTAVEVADISNPASPSIISSFVPASRVYSLAATADRLYVGTTSNGLMIYDTTDPTNLVLLGSQATNGRVNGIEIQGNTAYCAVSDDGLRIYDVTDPTAIVENGYYQIANQTWAYDIATSGSYAFTAYQTDFIVFDISAAAGINNPPDAFSLLSPADASKLTTNSVDLSWETATDAEDPVTYNVDVSTDGGTTWTTEATGLATTNYTLTVSPGESYMWKVFADDGENMTESTETWSFEILTGFSVSAFISANIQDTGIYGFLDETATDDYDIGVDIPEPANPADSYLTVYFDHDDWSPLPSRWMYDYRLPDDLVTTRENYHFNCRTDQAGQQVTLSFTLNTAVDLPTFLYDGTRYYDLTGLATYDHNFTPTVADQDYGFVIIFGESTAPVLDVTYPTADITFDVQTEYTVTFTTEDELPILDATVYYSMDDGTSWTEIATINNALDDTTSLVQSGTNSQAWTTPNDFYSYTLIRVVSTDFAGNVGETITSYTFNVAPSTMSQDYAPGWYMFGLPLMPNDLTISSVYSSFTNYFFLFDYTRATDYFFMGPESLLDFPRGYWMYLTGGTTETLTLDGANSSPQVDGTTLDLVEGWNVIGTGLPADFQRDSLSFTDGVDTYSWTDAVTNGWIANALFDYDELTDAYALETTMTARDGYWLYASAAGITMNVVPMRNGGITVLDAETPEGWFVPITLSQNDRSERIAGFGMHPEASSGPDQFDVPTPPSSPSDEFLRAVFNHADWDGLRRLSREVVAETEEYEFTMTVESSQPGMITLDFGQITDLLPDGMSAVAMMNGYSTDLLDQTEISFDYDSPKVIRIAVGMALNSVDDLSGVLPGEYAIQSIYPNPFNPTTEISIALPQASELSISLYNVTGQKVMDIVHGQQAAGIQAFTLNADGLASGIYFVKVTVPGHINTMKKVVLVR